MAEYRKENGKLVRTETASTEFDYKELLAKRNGLASKAAFLSGELAKVNQGIAELDTLIQEATTLELDKEVVNVFL